MGLVSAFVFVAVVTIIVGLTGDSLRLALSPTPLHPRAGPKASSTPGPGTGAVRDGIHVETGLVYDDNFMLVRTICTSCHSAKLVTQNRATRDGWEAMIRWMQETQGLGQLGENEDAILDYLAEHYAPVATGRRAPLEEIEWYLLELPAE